MTAQNTGGHIGVNKTTEKISSRYYCTKHYRGCETVLQNLPHLSDEKTGGN